MCGVAGFATQGDPPSPAADVLLERLATRGPDGGWWQEAAGWCLVQTRLAVVDLSDDVRYPMPNEDGSLLLLFNGEVYDHEVLRRDLERLGHRFRTECDAEVVVHGYEQWGSGVFPRLNAMFALALLDVRTGDLVLARDERGIKPLVRTTRGRPAFSSDAVSLVAAGLVQGEPDVDALAEFAAFHYVPEPLTGLRDVVAIEPGTAVTIRPDGATRTERWSPAVFAGAPPRHPVSSEEADAVLRAAVARQLKADVAVGVFLSSGIDSALVLHYAVEAGARPTAFTIGFPGTGDYDETTGASELARRLGVPHRQRALEVSFLDAVQGVGDACDVPLADESAIATLALAELAREEVTVALSGTGGDDLFAGYYRHRAHAVSRTLAVLPTPLVRRLAAVPHRRGGERRNTATLARSYAVRMARLAADGADAPDQYLQLMASSTSPVTLGALTWEADLPAARSRVGRRLGLRSADLDDLQDFELRSYLPGCILAKEDRTTMAHGLEARVPLLDDEVVALAARTPTAQRAGPLGGKLLLRRLAKQRLRLAPRKRGFAVPLQHLFEGPWRADAVAWLRDSPSELVDGPRAAALVGRPDGSALELWALCALRAWEDRLAAARRSASAVRR